MKGITNVVVFVMLILISILGGLIFYNYYYSFLDRSMKYEINYLEVPPVIVGIQTNCEGINLTLSYEKDIEGDIYYIIENSKKLERGVLHVNFSSGINILHIPTLLAPNSEYHLILGGKNWKIDKYFISNSDFDLFMDFNGNFLDFSNLKNRIYAQFFNPVIVNDFEEEPYNISCIYYNGSTNTCSISQTVDSFNGEKAIVVSVLSANYNINEINLTYTFPEVNFSLIDAISFVLKAKLGNNQLNNSRIYVYIGNSSVRLLNNSKFSIDYQNYKMFRLINSDTFVFPKFVKDESLVNKLIISIKYDKDLSISENSPLYVYLDTIALSNKTAPSFYGSSIIFEPYGDFIAIDFKKDNFDNYTIFILADSQNKLSEIKFLPDFGGIDILLNNSNQQKYSNITLCSNNTCMEDENSITILEPGINVIYLFERTNTTVLRTYLFGLNYKSVSENLNQNFTNTRIYISYEYPIVGKLDKFIIFNKKISKEMINYLSNLRLG